MHSILVFPQFLRVHVLLCHKSYLKMNRENRILSTLMLNEQLMPSLLHGVVWKAAPVEFLICVSVRQDFSVS